MFNGSDLSRAFDGLATILVGGVVALVIAVPLAIWKVVDISHWLWNHVHIE